MSIGEFPVILSLMQRISCIGDVMKKSLSLILSLIILPGLFCVTVCAEEVHTSARASALYCVNNATFLYEDNADERLPMASTTKILTALITLEEAAQDNRSVTFTQEMTAEGSSMYLQIGEQVRLHDLAVGMLMQSGNDAANAAAIAISGSYEAFAKRMNDRVAEIGMKDSHFVTPSGLDDDDHYSTARDMALLMAAAMENDDFRSITAQTSMTVDFIEPADKRVAYPNHNKLLRLYEGCIGGKTGYTDLAGRCLVSCAERDGLRLIAVTLDDGDDWDDHMALYDDAFSHYTLYTPDSYVTYYASVVGGETDQAALCIPKDSSFVIPAPSADRIRQTVYLPSFVYAPLKRGDTISRIVYTFDDKKIAEVPLRSADTIDYDDRPRGLIQLIKDVLKWHS